ncbi:MAG TPA: type II secretion system major pseudopilin GspG [Myxococcota bacterium]|nr:type II secretion system major pseudopilin GspG [Myxococcota bacterium]
MRLIRVNMRHATRAMRGFSLIEIMVVVTLMAIFIGLGTIYFTGVLKEGKINAARTQVHELVKAIDLYNFKTGSYPSTAEGLDVLVHPSKGEPVMEEIPKDPWGRDYNYQFPGTHNPKGFDLWSDGPDGEGGETAIGNWRSEEP